MNQAGNHGMLQPNPQQQGNCNNVNYNNSGNQQHQQHHHGHSNDPGGLMSGDGGNINVLNQMTMANPAWGKCPSQQQGNPPIPGMMTSTDIHHPSVPSPNNSFGASSNFNHYQQQHCFYPEQQQQLELRYNSSNSGNSRGVSMTNPTNQLRPSSSGGYVNDITNPTSGFYQETADDNDCHEQQQYYPQQIDQHHHHQGSSSSFNYDQQSQMKSGSSSCAMMSNSVHGHAGGGGNGNFYGYYNNQNSQYSQGMYPNQLNSGTTGISCDDEDFDVTSNRTHHVGTNNNPNRYFDPNHLHSTSNRTDGTTSGSAVPPVPTGVQGYFGTTSVPYGTSQQQCGGRYNNSSSPSPYNSHHHGHHQHHPPFRRKSMESYISEPGDMRYNNSVSKYGCSNFSSPSQPQSQYNCSPTPSPSSSTMIKRECLSNPSSSMPLPIAANNNNSSNCTVEWTRNDSNVDDVHMQGDSSGHQQQHPSQENYLYSTNTNINSHQNQSASSSNVSMNINMNYSNVNITYNSQSSNSSSNETGSSNFHHQHHISNFKSCIFEQSESKMDCSSEMKSVSYGVVKAASVKHRSLSLSVPLPSSSSYHHNRSDIIGLSHSPHPHHNTFTSQEHSNVNGGSIDCCNPMEKAGESPMSYGHSSSEHNSPHDHFTNYEDSPMTSDVNQSVQHQNQIYCASEPEQCSNVVTSCNSTQQSESHNVQEQHLSHPEDSYVGESLEKIDNDGESAGCGSSQSSPLRSSSTPITNNENDLCPSTPSHHSCDEGISHNNNTNNTSLLTDSSDFNVELPGSVGSDSLIIAEKAFESEDVPDPEADTDDLDKIVISREKSGDSNVISTTTSDIISSGVGNRNDCDHDSESNGSGNNSNCSFTSALFGIKRANSVSCNFNSCSDENDNESCTSGGSLTFGSQTNSKLSPQKIAKRSFSETDKDMVINTTLSFGGVSFGRKNEESQKRGDGGVFVPNGWKREVTYVKENLVAVYYVSPSDTKLRTLDELKNYICSDGTCKCGLSCPLRLENAFSFDPKVISLCVEKTGEDQDSLVYLNGSSSSEESQQHQHPSKSSLCNHYKRKIPKSEDSPLISSTRDDLGDCPEKKKRRTSGSSEFSTGNPGNATPNSKESPIPSSAVRSHVAVPCSQQSPDTTTQTPQTEMSPASSVSSEPPSGINFNPAGGARSLRSTPTPPSSSGKVGTPPGSKRQQGQCDFVWPPPPSTTQTQPLSSPSNSNNLTNTSNAWTSPTVAASSSSSQNVSANNNPVKKSGCHHLISKTNKRANSPCPNIDVRQIPPEHNRPPPKPGVETSTARMLPTVATTINTVPASHPGFNANISFFPVTSTSNEMTNLSMNLNSGFTISPIMQTSTCNTMSILSQPQISHMLPSTNVPCSLPMQIQKVITTPGIVDPTNAFIPQFQTPPVVLSVVGQPQSQIGTKAEDTSKLNTPVDANTSVESATQKSPLQLVQDVVNRFETKPDGESCNNDGKLSDDEKRLQAATGNSDIDKSTDAAGDMNEKPKSEISDGPSTNTNPPGDNSNISQPSIHTYVTGSTNLTTVPVEDTGNKTLIDNSSNVCNSNKPEATIISEPNKVESVATFVNTTTVSVAPMDQSTVTTCVTSMGNQIGTFTVPTSTHQQIILQAPQQSQDQAAAAGNFLSTTGQQQMRYPIIQTIQPFFLNSAGAGGGPLILSQQSQSHQTDSVTQQSFIYHHDPQQVTHHQQTTADHGIQSMLQPTTTMLFDPNTLCVSNPNLLGPAGGKKKKKRLSKKQQQQQAQLQLQQQLLLQQIQQAQQQQQAAAAFPLTIFPQSFNLGPQGFSLQPMNFFQTPTILTLPNLILNPADGTLFIQPSAPLSTTTSVQQNTVKFPLTTTTTLTSQPQQIIQHPNFIAPKKDNNNGTTILCGTGGQQILEVNKASSDAGSDDSRRNPTPDSSTGDIQLGLLNPSTPNQTSGNTIISITPHPTTTTTIVPTTNKKSSIKSRVVSSSSTVKRIFPQKQILPKIDSTTPSIENN